MCKDFPFILNKYVRTESERTKASIKPITAFSDNMVIADVINGVCGRGDHNVKG